MENGNYGSAISTDSLLLARGFGGGYGGFGGYGGGQGQGMYPGNSVLAAEAHANGTAVKEAIDCNAIRFSDGLNKLSGDFENQTRAGQIEALTKSITDAEFRGLDRQRDIERILNQNSKDAAKCCCDTQKLILEENGKTRELINSNELRKAIDTNNISATVGGINANANANTAAIIAAIQANGHHGGGGHWTPECPCQTEKVTVCHNGRNLEIALAALPAHLAHGDTFGECPTEIVEKATTVKKKK